MATSLFGLAGPQTAQASSLGDPASKTGIYGLTSDQQLAYYRQLLSQFAPAQYTPVQGNFEQGGEGAGSDQQAQQNAANAQVDVARNAAFEQTLSPQDRANYEALSKQYESNSNHSMDNMGIFSLIAAGIGGGLAGAYGGAAGTAGSGVAGGSAATGNMALIESGLGTAGYGGAGAAGTTGGLAAGGGAVGGGTLGFTGGSGAGLSGAGGETIGSNIGYQLGAQSAAIPTAGAEVLPAAAGGATAGGGATTGGLFGTGITAGQATSGAGLASSLAGAAGDGGAAEVANTGSDAHFYQNQAGGTGVQDLGNMGGSGTMQIPSWQYGANGAQQLLQSGGSNASQLGNLLSGGVGNALLGAGLGAAFGGSAGNLNIPDYKGAAQDQAASGRVDQSNPWGSLTYSQNGVDSHGNPVYKQNVSLNAADQSNLDSARQGQSSALFGLNNSISGYDAAVKALPGLYGDASSQEGLATQARDAMYHQQTALLDPQYKQQQDALESQLTNQGVVQGSQAWNTAMDSYARQRDYAYGNARDSSINQGNTYANQLFNQNLQAHNTGMSDLSTQQNQYLNTANGLSNTVKQPTFNSTSAPTNYLGGAALQGQGNLNQYNAQTGASNSQQNGLYQLGSAVMSNPTWTNYLGNLFSTGGG